MGALGTYRPGGGQRGGRRAVRRTKWRCRAEPGSDLLSKILARESRNQEKDVNFRGNEAKDLLQMKDLSLIRGHKRTQNEPVFGQNEAKKRPNEDKKRPNKAKKRPNEANRGANRSQK